MLEGDGLLALWNGVDPARAGEYDFWHTREHVPERVAIPGMLSARRYVGGDGALPRYLTLYDLENMAVLESSPYRALLGSPTPWSTSMRPSFRGFFRLACRPVARLGAGIGGALWATTLDLPESPALDASSARDLLRSALAIPAVTGAQFSVVDPESPPVPFNIGGTIPDYPQDAVLTLEGYDRDALASSIDAIQAWLATSVLGRSRTAWTRYALGYAIQRDELPDVVAAIRPPGRFAAGD